MSTRAHIVVTDRNVTHYVYHHHDGYLGGVGADLKRYIKSYIGDLGTVDYSSDGFCRYIEGKDPSYEYEDSGLHGDEEYIYHVTIDDSEVSVTADSIYYSGYSNRITEYNETFQVTRLQKKSSDEDEGIDSMTEILSRIISEFFKSQEGKRVLKESIEKYFNKG